jgi:hypothetical protein
LPTGKNIIDLGQLLQPGAVVTVTPPETPEDAELRRRKEMILFYTALGFVIVLACGCGWVTFVSDAEAYQKTWAMSIITGIATGFIGFLVGKRA